MFGSDILSFDAIRLLNPAGPANMNMHVASSASAPPHAGPSREELQPALLDRVTKSGRRLWYKLTVIQQPERARACGSGPKCKS